MNFLYEIKDVDLKEIGFGDVLPNDEKYNEIAELFAISFSNWLDKNFIKKKGAYYHKGNCEFSKGERDKRKLLKIFQSIK